MEYSEFIEELEISLQDQMKGETAFSIRAQTMQKNGEEHKEILYCRAGETWGLPLPTEEAYDDFLEGIPIEKIAQKMVKLMKRYTEVVPRKWRTEPALLPENIIPVLIPSEGNEALLETIPHIPFYDLQITFKFRVIDENGCDTVNVTNEYIREQGWTEKELLDLSLNNEIFKESALFARMSEKAEEMAVLAKADELEQLKDFREHALLLTNIYFDFGAASVLNQELMCRIADKFGENMYIIPADIEACMLVSESDLAEKDVQEILDCFNRFSPALEKKLSDHIYYFDREKREIQQIPRPEEKMEKHPVPVSDKRRR
ncbi:hypothetical protein H6A65_00430 [Mediterraneibacter glycyrrhizinilyticus]|uniref:DUF5688 family protein n=1 Tax=Mediterraneibacter glycyrrhizinilyticus TaxID=342942 RepID=UPI001961E9D7|nr:DUF5688 family protein [Mediterraneibacter glycyrrhizinilyticus]MBM6749969.1 hypothetical protein [Mediterraneibacter glycyrrhizinilyticus]